MARTFELITPLGPDVLLFHRMRAQEELSRIGEFELDLLSKRGDVNLDGILGKNVTVKLELPEDKSATSTASSRALRRSACTAATTLPRDRAALALVPDPHGRLPHLPGHDRAGHRQEGLRRITRSPTSSSS